MDGDAEYRERDRLWRQRQRESDPSVRQIERDYSLAYYQTNKESVLGKSSEYRKKQRAEHPEEVRARDREQRKRYVAMNQEEVIAKKQIKHLCECGGKYFRPQIHPCSVEKTSGILFQYPFINKRLPSIIFYSNLCFHFINRQR